VSPSALTLSSDDTSDDDDDDVEGARRQDAGSTTVASRSLDQDAATTYAARQRASSTRTPRRAASSSSSVLRLKIKKHIVAARRPPKRDRRTALVGRKLSAKVRGRTAAAGETTPVDVGSPEVKRCRPAHWSPVHSGRPAADVWLPPSGVRSLMDKVSITDVTANTLTVTVRECTTGEGFFRRSAGTDTEPPAPAASSSAAASPDPT